MKESYLVKRFNLELDRISALKFKNKNEPNLPTPMENQGTLDALSSMLELAESMIGADYSEESRIKESLLRRLLQKFSGRIPDLTNHSDIELSNDELDKVAGGLLSQRTNDTGCYMCGCRRVGTTIESDNCPNCGHPRSDHK